MTENESTLFPSLDKCVYTSHYCEENVWKLCDYFRTHHPEQLKNCYAVFISNKDRQVPLWQQKASKRIDTLVIWDYHVVLIYKSDDNACSMVLDLDTSLPFPCPLTLYFNDAIGPDATLKPEFSRWFRVVPAEKFLAEFASDRSHMLKEDGSWLAPPPSYPCIAADNSTNNLNDFISMDPVDGIGSVLSASQVLEKLS